MGRIEDAVTVFAPILGAGVATVAGTRVPLSAALAIGAVLTLGLRRVPRVRSSGTLSGTVLVLLVGLVVAFGPLVSGPEHVERVLDEAATGHSGAVLLLVAAGGLLLHESLVRIDHVIGAGGTEAAGRHQYWSGPTAAVLVVIAAVRDAGLVGIGRYIAAGLLLVVVTLHSVLVVTGVAGVFHDFLFTLSIASIVGLCTMVGGFGSFDGSGDGSLLDWFAIRLGGSTQRPGPIGNQARSTAAGGSSTSATVRSPASDPGVPTDTSQSSTRGRARDRMSDPGIAGQSEPTNDATTPFDDTNRHSVRRDRSVDAQQNRSRSVGRDHSASTRRDRSTEGPVANDDAREALADEVKGTLEDGGTNGTRTDDVSETVANDTDTMDAGPGDGPDQSAEESSDADVTAETPEGIIESRTACINCGSEGVSVSQRAIVPDATESAIGTVPLCASCHVDRQDGRSICGDAVPIDRERVIERNGGYCRTCGQATDGTTLELHPIVPLSGRGYVHEYNVVALCPSCHDTLHAD